ncbi:MAG: acetylxylan esterase [Prevotella sp.]|nr:acetylxylan esterase [Prevotella sp.]
MKKITFALFTILMLWTAQSLQAATIWTGEQPINWNNSKYIIIGASEFGNAQVADIIRLNIVFTGNTNYPQVGLQKGNWSGGLSCAGNTNITASTTAVDYYITTAMLEDLLTTGLLITGIGYTLKSVEIIEGEGSTGNENAVWMGNTVILTDWSNYQVLPASCFTKATVGKIIRLKYKDLQSGAQAILRTGDWKEMPGMASFVQLSGNHIDITITADMLTKLKSNGCIVQGLGFTLTRVDLIDEEEVSRLQLNVPIKHQWLWVSPEKPMITVNVTNPTQKAVQANAEIVIKTDKMGPVNTLSQQKLIEAGASAAVDFSFDLAPGFYQCTALVNDEVARSFVIGVDPEQVVSEPDMRDDFLTFWQQTKEQLATVEPQYTLTEIPSKSSSQRKVYLLEMRSLADAQGEGIVRAYYAEPTASGTFPALIHYNGYDGGNNDPWCMGGNDNPGYCEIIVSTRGQLINNRPPYSNTYGDWFVYGFSSKDTYYYRGAYMDCVRAIDFLCSREKVQQQNIFAEGASQGGAFTLAAAALGDNRLNAIAPAVPFMGDFPDYFKVASWPGNAAQAERQRQGMPEEEMFTMLSYFDTKNLATLITCPTYMNYSLQDNVCPPHINWAAYNNLASTEKKYLTNPALGHQTASNWNSEFMTFFKAHLKSNNTTGITTITTTRQDNDDIYNMQGVRMTGTLSTLPHGIYIQGGRKIIR